MVKYNIAHISHVGPAQSMQTKAESGSEENKYKRSLVISLHLFATLLHGRKSKHDLIGHDVIEVIQACKGDSLHHFEDKVSGLSLQHAVA
jgi:hypothetical protein